jgi:hypothetical protein
MDNSHLLTDNNLSSPKLRIFLTFFATFLALTSLIGLYTTTDFGAVIILIIFAIPSIFGGFLGGLLGNVLLRKRNNDTAKINWSSSIWLIFGPLWGFDIFCAILILFFTLFTYISMFSVAIITLGLISALVLVSTPVILIIFTALPAILVTYLTLSTEHVSYTDNLLKKLSPKLNSRFVVGIIILSFASCFLSIPAMTIPYKLIIGDDQHDTLHNESD